MNARAEPTQLAVAKACFRGFVLTLTELADRWRRRDGSHQHVSP
jgi:hypothetical protein